ncbi:MAG: hypothetical protein ACOH2A_06745 [Sphingobacteriaceae bacterium]
MVTDIYIRVDGDVYSGLGHSFRCLALAHMLKQSFIIHFVSKSMPDNMVCKIIGSGYSFKLISDEREFFSLLKGLEIVVVDSYFLKKDFYKAVKSYGSVVVSIQDVYHFSENIDLVINHLPNVERFYHVSNVICGPKYAIIREEFLEEPIIERPFLEGVFISLGGTINYKIVNELIIKLRELGIKKINVLTTSYNRQFIEDNEHVTTLIDLNANSVIKIIDDSELCFITPGMVLYEVLSRNKKAVVGSLNEGQNELAERFHEEQLVDNVGYWNGIKADQIKEVLQSDHINLQKVSAMFDNKSGKRILEIFQTL